jgi:hypothetical protein
VRMRRMMIAMSQEKLGAVIPTRSKANIPEPRICVFLKKGSTRAG